MLVCDNNEKNPVIIAGCDSRADLCYDKDNHFTLDFRLTTHANQTITAERKEFKDFNNSWYDGKLPRQASNVDLLIVEVALEDLIDADPLQLESALKHIGILSSQMWVHQTRGPQDTIDFLRHLEQREGGLTIRQNKLRSSAPTTRQRILEAMPGLNPYRDLGNGFTVGQQLEGVVDWRGIAKALKVESWTEAVSWNGCRPIPRATLGRIQKELIGDAP